MTEITSYLNQGDAGAPETLLPLVYDELRRLAASRLAGESPGQTLQPTALVHEVYLRLLGKTTEGDPLERRQWDNRGHFFAAAAEAMRRILVEGARRKSRVRHGGGRLRESLEPNDLAAPETDAELLALDEALNALSSAEPRIAELVQLRFFGGLTIKEAAAVLGISPRTADADWAYARAWLLAAMQSE